MKRFIFFLCLASLFGCQNKDRWVSRTNQTRPINDLKDLVLTKGDTVAYKELLTAYKNHNGLEAEYLLYSLVMANKYNYSKANFFVFSSLIILFERDGQLIDERTKSLALDYLKRGVYLHDPQAIYNLGQLYMEGRYVQKDTLLGKKMIDEGKKIFR